MDIQIVLGWADMDTMKILEVLEIVSETDATSDLGIDNDFDNLAEFVVSQLGTNIIKDRINNFNAKHGTDMEWRVIEDIRCDNTYMLVWKILSKNTICNPETSSQVDMWGIKHTVITNTINMFNGIVDKHYSDNLDNSKKDISGDNDLSPDIITITDSSKLIDNVIKSIL